MLRNLHKIEAYAMHMIILSAKPQNIDVLVKYIHELGRSPNYHFRKS